MGRWAARNKTLSDCIITDHAVQRFIERLAPHLKLGEARALLQERSLQATNLGVKTRNGQEQWLVGDPYCILVIKYDWDYRQHVCVTVLPEPEAHLAHRLKGRSQLVL